jgi:hypothetical protein
MYGEQARLFEDEIRPHLRHKARGMVRRRCIALGAWTSPAVCSVAAAERRAFTAPQAPLSSTQKVIRSQRTL